MPRILRHQLDTRRTHSPRAAPTSPIRATPRRVDAPHSAARRIDLALSATADSTMRLTTSAMRAGTVEPSSRRTRPSWLALAELVDVQAVCLDAFSALVKQKMHRWSLRRISWHAVRLMAGQEASVSGEFELVKVVFELTCRWLPSLVMFARPTEAPAEVSESEPQQAHPGRMRSPGDQGLLPVIAEHFDQQPGTGQARVVPRPARGRSRSNGMRPTARCASTSSAGIGRAIRNPCAR